MQDRIAELEAVITREGISLPAEHSYVAKRQPSYRRSLSPSTPPPPHNLTPIDTHRSPDRPASSRAEPAFSTVAEILRDLSLEASGGYIGASSQITMGRLIGSIVQAKEYSCNSSKGTAWEHLSPKSANSAPPTSETDFDLSRVPTHVAERLFRGYIRHISTRWPVLQTPQVQRLHVSRDSLSDTFKCVLSKTERQLNRS